MFIGHYALAFASRKAAPKASLGWLVLGVSFLDLLWPLFLLFGWERVAPRPGGSPFLRLDFISYPWTHSLAMALAWSAAVGGLYLALRKDTRGALVIGLCVLSHWALDWATHLPDLPLWPHGPVAGLGLWKSTSMTLIVEGLMFAGGLALYLRATRARNGVGRWACIAFAAFLLIAYFGATFGPPPADMGALAWSALLCWLFPLWAWWFDKNREAVTAPA